MPRWAHSPALRTLPRRTCLALAGARCGRRNGTGPRAAVERAERVALAALGRGRPRWTTAPRRATGSQTPRELGEGLACLRNPSWARVNLVPHHPLPCPPLLIILLLLLLFFCPLSSDMFFGRNEPTEADRAANTVRTTQFSGAQAISSDQWFGREGGSGKRGLVARGRASGVVVVVVVVVVASGLVCSRTWLFSRSVVSGDFRRGWWRSRQCWGH